MWYLSSYKSKCKVSWGNNKDRYHNNNKSDSDDSQTSQHDWDPYGEELDDIAEELREIILSDYE